MRNLFLTQAVILTIMLAIAMRQIYNGLEFKHIKQDILNSKFYNNYKQKGIGTTKAIRKLYAKAQR